MLVMDVVQSAAVNLWKNFLLLARSPHTLLFSSDPRDAVLVFVVSLMVACFVVSILLDNYSQVDRWWSILPALVVAFYWYRSPRLDARLTLMAALTLAWGVRLTFNFWRKGGYHWKDEDYRWQPLKARIRPYPLWLLFNMFFICIFQLSLLFLIASPADVAYRVAGKVPLNSMDLLLTFAFGFLLTVESIADQQQWTFQKEKYRLIESGAKLVGDYKRGFITTGLFRYSRHPNFFCEIAMWWVMYLFGVSATGKWLHWTLAGPILLTLLFQGSTTFTERLSAAKYPDYVKYQQRTSRLIPMFRSSKSNGEKETSSSSGASAATSSSSPMSHRRTNNTVAAPLSPRGGASKKHKSSSPAAPPMPHTSTVGRHTSTHTATSGSSSSGSSSGSEDTTMASNAASMKRKAGLASPTSKSKHATHKTSTSSATTTTTAAAATTTHASNAKSVSPPSFVRAIGGGMRPVSPPPKKKGSSSISSSPPSRSSKREGETSTTTSSAAPKSPKASSTSSNKRNATSSSANTATTAPATAANTTSGYHTRGSRATVTSPNKRSATTARRAQAYESDEDHSNSESSDVEDSVDYWAIPSKRRASLASPSSTNKRSSTISTSPRGRRVSRR